MINYRKLMGKKLGRKLCREEIIHHKDGNSMNNALYNLEIISPKQHYEIHRKIRKEKLPLKLDWTNIITKITKSNIENLDKHLDLFFSISQKEIIYKN